jgi:uncharacterized protein
MKDNPNIFSNDFETIKYTLIITQRCNLACDYCYIEKKRCSMSISTANKIIDFIFANSPERKKIDIAFFGGEPLLEFDLIKKITNIIQSNKYFDLSRVKLSLVTNGTIFSDSIKEYLIENNIGLCLSCDGPAIIHNAFRHFPDGRGSSEIVEKNIKSALKEFPLAPINAVYSPENLQFLPTVVDYLSSLGARNIYLSPNIFARWTKNEADILPSVYNIIAEKYKYFYMMDMPIYISIIDGKITAILRGGYKPSERCRMGNMEFAFSPTGNIYPCERLMGSDDGNKHCLGNINNESIPEIACHKISSSAINSACQSCGLKDYCMNWCGCTNYYLTGRYNIVDPFICASERAAINVAFKIIQEAADNGWDLSHHIIGSSATFSRDPGAEYFDSLSKPLLTSASEHFQN